jgi:hypothetical protein
VWADEGWVGVGEGETRSSLESKVLPWNECTQFAKQRSTNPLNMVT